MQDEIWKYIDGYSTYMVSNYGRVKSFQKETPKILKQAITHRGYATVRLYHNTKWKIRFVHHLVAEAFIDNPNGYHEINHKDENKLNNHIDNLEWCDRSYNLNYGSYKDNMRDVLTNRKDLSKQVFQFTLDDKLITSYLSTQEAYRKTGISQSNISAVCRGERNQAGGYKWKYYREVFE